MARRRRASQSSGGAVSPDRDVLQGPALQISWIITYSLIPFSLQDAKIPEKKIHVNPVLNPQMCTVPVIPTPLSKSPPKTSCSVHKEAAAPHPLSASGQWMHSCCLPRSSEWNTRKCTRAKTTGGCMPWLLAWVLCRSNQVCVLVNVCVCHQSHQRPPRWAVEENAKWGASRVHPAGQSTRRRAEKTQPRLLETETNQLCEYTHAPAQLHPLFCISASSCLFVLQGCQGN